MDNLIVFINAIFASLGKYAGKFICLNFGLLCAFRTLKNKINDIDQKIL